MPQFSVEEIQRLLAKHGLPSATPERAEFEGVVNEIWFAGDVVVRINKNLNYESDVWTESVAVPELTAFGIQTPKLLAFDQDLDIVPRLVTIYERAPGIPLSKIDHLTDPERLFYELGKIILSFHERVTEVNDPNSRLDPAWTINFERLKSEATNFDLNERQDSTPVFCHQDLHPDNILVHEGKLSAVIDWGDAGWADRSVDFRYIPARFLKATLEGYGPISRETMQNIRLHQLDQFLYAQRENRSYGRYGDTTREELNRFLES